MFFSSFPPPPPPPFSKLPAALALEETATTLAPFRILLLSKSPWTRAKCPTWLVARASSTAAADQPSGGARGSGRRAEEEAGAESEEAEAEEAGGDGETPALSTTPSRVSSVPFIASTNSKTERGEERSSGKGAARAQGEEEVEVEADDDEFRLCWRWRSLISATAASHASRLRHARMTS